MNRIWGTVFAVMISAGALAQVTGLATIPVADTKGVREAEFGYYISGTE